MSSSLGFTNPHAFIIELYLAFGIIALLSFTAYIAVYALTCISAQGLSSKARFIALFSMIIFLVAGFIPSTIMRMPFIWLPGFLIFIYVICNNTQRDQTLE